MRLRLFLAFALVVVISVTGVILLVRQSAARELNAYMFRGGMYGAEGIVGALEDYYRQHGSWNGVDQLFQSGHGMGRGMGGGSMMNQRFRLADASGTLIVDTAGSSLGSLSQDEIDQSIDLNVGNHTVGYLLPAGGSAFTSSDSAELLNRLNRAALIAALIGGAVSLLLAFVLAYGLLRPVGELTQAAEALSLGDLNQRVPVKGSDEIAQLSVTFNQMAESLQQAESSRRALTADIAHELRTPLAVQRANLEAIQDGVYPPTAENLQSVLEQNLLLTRLVDDLRTLALADSGQLQLERNETDLVNLTQAVLERFSAAAAKQQVSLSIEKPEDPLPMSNVDHLRVEQILHNLIANALHHTPEGGTIICSLLVQGKEIVITIRDSGPGIPPEALPYVFERFYRADKARSRNQGGSGLGLAIARQLAEAHHGTLTAANYPEGGAIFTLALPISEK